MTSIQIKILVLACAISFGLTSGRNANGVQDAQSGPSAASTTRPVGTVKAISGNVVTLTTDAGSIVSVSIQDSTRLVRIAPGQKDLKGATALNLSDLQVGDRMLVRGTSLDEGKSLVAASAIVMTGTDIATKQQLDRQDWQKRGVGGLVTAVDAGKGSITLSTAGGGGSKTLTILVSKSTRVRRYAPDSVKFDDATPGALDEIRAGDQLRARGSRSEDGAELAAEEIVSGTFRNIAGTVISADPAANTVNVMDLSTKKPVILKINGDSQLHNLPPMAAQRIAARLKGSPAESGGSGATAPNSQPASNGRTGDNPASGSAGSTKPGGGSQDFQQMLNRMPALALADLQKGDAVMIVATQGTANTQPTAITLLTGVEAILTASPDSGKAAMLLSPWNLGGGSDAAAGANP